jgi:monofunctional biosynthetic peptidoglycan transglycosylase
MRIKFSWKGLLLIPLFIVYLHLAFIQATLPVIFWYRHFNPQVTGIMLYRAVFYRWPLKKLRYVPLKGVPSQTRRMIIKVEDGSFYSHNGVVLAALKNAWSLNKGLGKPTYGGSTITMQTARTLFLVPEKSYLRKYLEMIIALEMEQVLGKDRIFELYLNYAEWGKGVFGIQAGSVYHYGRGVTNLSVDESVRLVTLLSSPVKYRPYTLHKNGILLARYNYLVSRFE